MKKAIWKKLLAVALCVVTLCGVVPAIAPGNNVFSVEAEAAISKISADKYSQTVLVGQKAVIVLTMDTNTTDYVNFYLYNSNGENCLNNTNPYYLSKNTELTYTLNTAGASVGTYRFVVKSSGGLTCTVNLYLTDGVWKQDSKGWWYQRSNGSYPVNQWEKIGGAWYYFNGAGYMVTGWNAIGGKWYYMGTSGAMVVGWQKISNTWYYFNASGAMVTGWQKIGGAWYYFKSSGAMVTGWNAIGGKWYYMSSSGAMLVGWQKISNTWYYFNGSGAMVTGWQDINGKTYYFKDSGAMITGWGQDPDGNIYYFNSSGAMVTGSQYIDGKNYYFNADGILVG